MSPLDSLVCQPSPSIRLPLPALFCLLFLILCLIFLYICLYIHIYMYTHTYLCLCTLYITHVFMHAYVMYHAHLLISSFSHDLFALSNSIPLSLLFVSLFHSNLLSISSLSRPFFSLLPLSLPLPSPPSFRPEICESVLAVRRSFRAFRKCALWASVIVLYKVSAEF